MLHLRHDFDGIFEGMLLSTTSSMAVLSRVVLRCRCPGVHHINPAVLSDEELAMSTQEAYYILFAVGIAIR